jgi:ligand-binding sensor domain-containing protein
MRKLLPVTLLFAACDQALVLASRPQGVDWTSPGTQIPASPQIADYVVAALEDRQGNLWFGTNGQGVACYQPATGSGQPGKLIYFSTREGLIDDVVTDIVEDQAGRLWFGTHRGASLYDPQGAPLAAGPVFLGFGPTAGLTGSGCKLLVDRQGTLWAGTGDGAFRFDGERFRPFELPTPPIETPTYKVTLGKVWDLMEDSHGCIWFARDGLGACRYDPRVALAPGTQAFTHFTQNDGLCSNNVASLAEDRLGHIWFGSITSDHPRYIPEGGLSRYDPQAQRQPATPLCLRFPELKGLSGNDVYNIYLDRTGQIWIGAVGVGAYRYAPNTGPGSSAASFGLFDQADRPDLIPTLAVQAMLHDRQGTLWFGFSGGLFRFEDGRFLNVTQSGPWESR